MRIQTAVLFSAVSQRRITSVTPLAQNGLASPAPRFNGFLRNLAAKSASIKPDTTAEQAPDTYEPVKGQRNPFAAPWCFEDHEEFVLPSYA